MDIDKLSDECSPLGVALGCRWDKIRASVQVPVIDYVISPFHDLAKGEFYILECASSVTPAARLILRMLEQAHLYYWWLPRAVRLTIAPISYAYWITTVHTDELWTLLTAPNVEIVYSSNWDEVTENTRRFLFNVSSAVTKFPLYYEVVDSRYERYGANYTARAIQPYEPKGHQLVSSL